MPRFKVRHLALGHIAEHEVLAAGPRAVPSALAALLGCAVGAADVLQVSPLQEAPAGGPGVVAPGVQAGTSAPVRRGRLDFPSRLFCQELAVLLDAGIPLFEALVTLREKESSPAVARVLSSLIDDLEQGQTLAQAMRHRPEAFSTLLVASVEASQRTGHTPEALRQHGAYLAWVGGMRDKLVSALIYPAILVTASFLVITFLTVFVVPRFADIYEGMGGELPWLSGLLLRIGQVVGQHPGGCWVASRLW